MHTEPIYITGIGTANPLGVTYAEVTRNLLAGVCGIRSVNGFDASNHSSRIAGHLPEIPVPAHWDAATFAKLNRWQQLALWCGIGALDDSGLWDKRTDLRIGVVLGIGAEWVLKWEHFGLRNNEPLPYPDNESEGVSQWLHRELGLQGGVATVAAACASGNIALGMARMWLQCGWVDVCIAGACDLPVTPMAMAGFGNLTALSRRNDNPAKASRPFDKNRDGFVMGEGAAMFVLEPESRAHKRGAKTYAELAGFGATSDGFHLVIPSSDPLPAADAIRAALRDARLNISDVDYINAHGTSTPVGDPFEARAIEAVFGHHTNQIPVSSTKGMTGHLVSAAAAVEVISCLTAFESGALPPTINLDEVDAECARLRHIPHAAQDWKSNVVLSNSFGFGGSNTCIVLKKAS